MTQPAKTGRPLHAVLRGERDDDLRRLHADGKRIGVIALHVGCCREVARRRLVALDLEPDGRICNRGRSRHTVTLGLHDADLLRMRAQRIDPWVIGQAFKCSDGTVLNRLAALKRAGAAANV